MVVSWGSDGVEYNGTEFQVWLHRDGTLEYLYEYGTWAGGGTIAVGSQPISHTPGVTGRDSLLLVPTHGLVTCTPSSGTLAGFGGARTLTFSTAVESWQSLGTNMFTATVNGDDTSASLDIVVVVQQQTMQLDVPAAFTFSGLAGAISPAAYLTVTNSGNVPLTYTITDTGAQSGGYTSDRVDQPWRHIPVNADTTLDDTELGTTPVDIGFPFVFFGSTYTRLTVGVDGTLMLGDNGAAVIPFSAGLLLNENTGSVRFMTDSSKTRMFVTWDKMSLPTGGKNLMFQAVLYRDGSIRFKYEYLEGDWPSGIIQLSNGTTTVTGTLSNDTTTVTSHELVTTTTYVTNKIGNAVFVDEVEVVTGTNVVVTYNDTVVNQCIEFTLGHPPVITFSPVSDTVAAGETAEVVLKGDARSLTGGAPFNSVTNSTELTFAYGATNAAADIAFVATNSVEAAFADPVVQAAMWGTADGPAIVSSQINADGSRTLSWPAANDTLSRTYTVWYTTSLSDHWEWLATVINDAGYLDNSHNTAPVIFYKVTVE